MGVRFVHLLIATLVLVLSAPLARAEDEGDKAKGQQKDHVPPGLQKKGGLPPGQAKKKGKKGAKEKDSDAPAKSESTPKGVENQTTPPPVSAPKVPEPVKPGDKPSKPASPQVQTPETPKPPGPATTTPPPTSKPTETKPAKSRATSPSTTGGPVSKEAVDKKTDLDRGVAGLNQTSGSVSTSDRKSLTSQAARSLGVSQASLEAQAKAHPEVGLGDLYVANSISKSSKASAESLIAQNKGGKSWGKIAEENKANLDQILTRLNHFNKTASKSQIRT